MPRARQCRSRTASVGRQASASESPRERGPSDSAPARSNCACSVTTHGRDIPPLRLSKGVAGRQHGRGNAVGRRWVGAEREGQDRRRIPGSRAPPRSASRRRLTGPQSGYDRELQPSLAGAEAGASAFCKGRGPVLAANAAGRAPTSPGMAARSGGTRSAGPGGSPAARSAACAGTAASALQPCWCAGGHPRPRHPDDPSPSRRNAAARGDRGDR